MTGFFLRKSQRLKTFATMRYFGDGVAGEGIIQDLSLNGSYITGNRPVSVGMVLALHIFVPGDTELLLIDRATVKWVKKSKFGVDFDTHEPKVAERITQVIAMLVKKQRGSPDSE
jgi:PilZ domain-containing protein